MKFACIIRLIGTEDYLNKALEIVPRQQAFIGRRVLCEEIAIKKFGPCWMEQAEIFEVPEEEYFSYLGRKTSWRKKLAVRRNAKMRKLHRTNYQRLPRSLWKRIGRKPVYTEEQKEVKRWWHNQAATIAVRGTLRDSTRLLRRAGFNVQPGELRRSWINTRPAPELPPSNGIYELINNQWQRHL